METYDAKKEWGDLYKTSDIAYPPEALIRILLGTFPELNFFDKSFNGKSILDLGYGDGRNFPLFHRLQLNIHGVEISKDIVKSTIQKSAFKDYTLTLKSGTTREIPFESHYFDYTVSWNSCYYMESTDSDFQDHAREIIRVTRPGGYLIISVPAKSCFIYNEAEDIGNGNVTIRDDYFGLRNGQVMKQFSSNEELKSFFDAQCEKIALANLNMEWFGLAYNWHILVGKINTQ